MQTTPIEAGFAVSPQLRREDVETAAREGFRAIVNNRPDGEAPDQPSAEALEAEARRLGLDYIHIPIVPGEMTEADGRRLKAFLDEVQGPVLAFCRTGNRSANLWKLARQLG